MKNTRKIFSVVLAIVLVFAMAIPAFAAETGTITITNAVIDETYSAYQMLTFTPAPNVDNAGVYKVADGWADFFSGDGATYFDVAENDGTVTLKEGADLTALAAAAITYAEGKTATASAVAKDKIVELSALPLGYYVVDTSLGTICALTNTNSEETLIEKNKQPTLTKEVQEDRDSKWYASNDAAIGQDVNFSATITVGKGTASNYVLHDKMEEGLSFKNVTSITLNGETTDSSDYTVTTEGLNDGCTFEIDFTSAFEAKLKEGDEIVVNYTATLNEDASIGLEDGNENTAWLTYGDDNTTEKSETTTYTYKISVDKVDDEGNALEGAGFTLYTWDATIDSDEETEGIEGGWTQVGSEITGVTKFVWEGLDEGKYKLEETTVPEGYNKADDIEFTITSSIPAGKSVSANGVFNDTLTAKVENLTGGLLPETGGIGTTIFYIVGALLVVGAVVLLITKKRMSAEA